MKIFRPGFPVVDDQGPSKGPKSKVSVPSPSVSVAEAMKLADQRQTQVLNYGRTQKPLVDNSAITPPGQPHAVNDKPEVQK